MQSQFLSSAARFPSRDFDATQAFYARFGFRAVSRHGGVYLILRRDGVELHFTPAPETWAPEESHQSAYVRVLNAARFAADTQSLDLPDTGVPRFVGMELTPWGMYEAQCVDPDGSVLIFGAADETFGDTAAP